MTSETEEGDGGASAGRVAARHGSPSSNLLLNLPAHLPEELVEVLHQSPGVRIERIVSRGHTAPADDDWYDQAWDEWVVLLTGAARLAFPDGREQALNPGDWLLLPAHCRHRVAWTDPAVHSVWLAVHVQT